MANLNPTDFYNKWQPLFADNITKNITEAYMRAFMLDIKDSFINLNSYPQNISDAVNKKHEHTAALANIEDAVSKRHAHTSQLDDIEDAVQKKHEHTDIDAINSILMEQHDISPPDILNLKNQSIDLIACPAGCGIAIVKAICTLVFGTTEYACDDFYIAFSGGTDIMIVPSGFLQSNSTAAIMIREKATEDIFIAENIILRTDTDPTLGDGILRIRIYYHLITLT